MASETVEFSTDPKMIVQYEWILENVEKEPITIASKMILFRGERVFRVGLKNLVKSPVLFCMSVYLNKMGRSVEGVTYGIQENDNSPVVMKQMTQENIGEDRTLQLFTIKLDELVIGNKTFVFRIHIEGSVPGYSYRLSDRLAKDQLWEAATSQYWANVQLVVKGKTFYVHKAILAARSPVLAAQFAVVTVGLHQIHIDGVEPSTVEQFLHFIYTGEPMGTLANEELLKVANQYQLTTLSGLCRVALEKINPRQMANLVINLNKDAEISSSSSIIRPEKDTEIFFDGTTPTFRFASSFDLSKNKISKCVGQYQNEDIFTSYITGKLCLSYDDQTFVQQHAVIHCSCAKHRSFGLEVEDLYFCDRKNGKWLKMESKHLQKNAELLHFTTHTQSIVYQDSKFYFDVKMVTTIGNYYYEMMDDEWMKNFWFAATNEKFTDVEIFVGAVKVMEAHRVILSARSPVLNQALRNINNYIGKSIVTFGAEFDVDIVKHFLKFLYTGSVEACDVNKQLLELATKYKVETLKNFCQLANRVLDAEELTNSLLEL